jgi:hypothetical protein
MGGLRVRGGIGWGLVSLRWGLVLFGWGVLNVGAETKKRNYNVLKSKKNIGVNFILV